MHMADATPLTLADLDLMVEHAHRALGTLLSPPVHDTDMMRAPGMASTLESLLRSREMLAPRQPVTPPSTSNRPGLRQETLSDSEPEEDPQQVLTAHGVPLVVYTPGPSSTVADRIRWLSSKLREHERADKPAPLGNEMLANATRERIRATVDRMGKYPDPASYKADVLKQVETLHGLAVGRTPAERERKLEDVANAARDMHCGVAGAQQRLEDALFALDGVRARPASHVGAAKGAESMRSAVLTLLQDKVNNLGAHVRAGETVGLPDDARRWTAQADILKEAASDIGSLPLPEVQ
jgi:hypothetical protein